MNIFRGFLFGALFASPALLEAALLDDLSAADQAKVKAGGQVTMTEVLDGYPWPRVTVYQQVNATPAQVMAVFFDYNNAHKFIPNCMKSEVAAEISPSIFEVNYIIDVPILPDEAYTVRNELSKQGLAGFKVKWRVLKATSIEESAGNLEVEPGSDGTVLRYTNLVKPSSRAAFLLKGVAIAQMKDTVQAIVDQVKKQVSEPDGMNVDLARLKAALGDPAP